jgi:hypothetical protein
MAVSSGFCPACKKNRTLFDGMCVWCRTAMRRKIKANKLLAEKLLKKRRETENGIANVRAKREEREKLLALREAKLKKYKMPGSHESPSVTKPTRSERPQKAHITKTKCMKCPQPCSNECEACYGAKGGHHWVEIDKNEVMGNYRCRNCSAKADYESVFAEEVGHRD